MTLFVDTKTGIVTDISDGVQATKNADGSYSFVSATGEALVGWPTTLVPYTPPAAPAMSLVQAISAQTNMLTQAAQVAMTGGFTSSALGSAYTYPSALTDQINLSASVTASLLPNLPSTWTTEFSCADSIGTWADRPHTAAQIQQVGVDAKTWITNQRNQLKTLLAQVAAATTVAAVQAISWVNG